jgi:hypothetical protein
MGNAIAYLALVAWPGVIFLFFKFMTPQRAIIWSILGGYLLLPPLTAINLPAIPALTKETIPNVTAFVMCIVLLGKFPQIMPESWLGRILLVVFIFSPVATSLTNDDALQFGTYYFGSFQYFDPNFLETSGLPALRLYDSISFVGNQLFWMLPFFMAREFLRTEAAMREILLALVIAGLIYALPMLYELRFSPQLNIRVYGFFQHDFAQSVRASGYRPFVFMPHGLWVAFFAFMCFTSAVTLLVMSQAKNKLPRLGLSVFMAGLVVICKSMGAILFSLIFVPVLVLLRTRAHLRIAAVLAVIAVVYPAIRGSGVIPSDDIVRLVTSVSADRAQSLEYRFNNENILLDHAAKKPWFGWGSWGRNLVYDQITGEVITIPDGEWIITIGVHGWVGYVAKFGLLALPLILLWLNARRRHAPEVSKYVSGLALILAANLVDLIPNATLIPFTWLIAGAILGFAEELARQTRDTERALIQARRRAALAEAGPAPAAPRASGKRRTVL